MTDDGQFVGVVRFESREAAARNSLRPEQGAWWEEVSRCFDGEVTFHDCDDAIMMLDGGSDDAGVRAGDPGPSRGPGAFPGFMSQPMDALHEARPEIIGGTIAIDEDGWFTETMSFRSEAEARKGEAMEMPDEVAEPFNREMEQVQDMRFLDLHHPSFATAGPWLTAGHDEARQVPGGLRRAWTREDSNLRPPPCQGGALTICATRPWVALGVLLEVETGFEPVYAALQAAASPLGHSTTGGG